MDTFISFFAMPIGVLICFGPALVAWLLAEFKPAEPQRPADKK